MTLPIMGMCGVVSWHCSVGSQPCFAETSAKPLWCHATCCCHFVGAAVLCSVKSHCSLVCCNYKQLQYAVLDAIALSLAAQYSALFAAVFCMSLSLTRTCCSQDCNLLKVLLGEFWHLQWSRLLECDNTISVCHLVHPTARALPALSWDCNEMFNTVSSSTIMAKTCQASGLSTDSMCLCCVCCEFKEVFSALGTDRGPGMPSLGLEH